MSYTQVIKFGEHCVVVSATEAGPTARKTLFFSLTTDCTASATEDVGTSSSTSTPSRSNHSRLIDTARSGLFWWSAVITCTLRPCAEANSSIACLVQITEVTPPVSR